VFRRGGNPTEGRKNDTNIDIDEDDYIVVETKGLESGARGWWVVRPH
jgi:hypothetical protein